MTCFLYEHAERIEAALQHGLGVVAAEPLLDRRGVDAPEVRRHLHVAVVEIGEARMLAVEAALDALADDEHRRRGAVIGAEAAVLFDAASELGEDHDGDFVRPADALEVLDESAHGVGGVHQQPAMEIGLLHVRVERVALIGDVVEARRHLRRR